MRVDRTRPERDQCHQVPGERAAPAQPRKASPAIVKAHPLAGVGLSVARVAGKCSPELKHTGTPYWITSVGGEGGFEPTVRLPVQRFSSSKVLTLARAVP